MSVAKTLQAAIGHHQAGRLADAERGYRKVLRAEPTNPDAFHLLGVVSLQRGMNDAAVELIEKAHRFGQPHPVSLNNLGKAHLGLGRLVEARRCFEAALALKPELAEALCYLGVALAESGETGEAERRYREALALEPALGEAHFRLANLLSQTGRLAEAEQAYRRTLALVPGFADAHANLGCTLQDLGRLEEAEACVRRALELDPDRSEIHNNLGSVLKEQGRLDEAVRSYHNALARKPEAAAVHYNLGNALYDLGRLEEAGECFNRAMSLDPDYAAARWASTILKLSSLLTAADATDDAEPALREIRDLRDWFDSRRRADDANVVGVQQPFFLAYEERSHRDLLAEYGKLCADLMQRWGETQRLAPAPPRTTRRNSVRVGIVSAHVRNHSVWHAMVKGWLSHIDRDRFDLQLFYTESIQDEETAFAESRVSHFEHGKKPLAQWVRSILDARPDVLVYPEIGMDPVAVKLASLRLAPVQVATWGHPVTTGLPLIEYYLSAEDFEPEGAQEHYTEELVILPHLGCCYTPVPPPDVRVDLPALGIDAESPLLLCPGTPFKYSPRFDWIFPEIARRLQRCRFIFFALEPEYLAQALKRRLESAFGKAQLDFTRYVAFVPRQSRPAFHALMRRADVFLDTLGFSGFNTAMQAVECGLPIVTREGRFMRGRFASGILKRAQLQELVAVTEEDYVRLAVKITSDAEYRNQIRERLHRNRQILYADPTPIRSLEQFLIAAAERRT